MGKGTSNMFKLLQDNPASKDRLGFGPALVEGAFHATHEVHQVRPDQRLQGGEIEGLFADESVVEEVVGNELPLHGPQRLRDSQLRSGSQSLPAADKART